jgi:hypothetical protein
MVTRFLHHLVIMVAPLVWSVFRRMPWLGASIARLILEMRYVYRRGRLHGNQMTQKYLENILLPCDIVINRGAPNLSDTLIPGYFKHAAVFLGDELAHEIIKTASANGAPSPLRGHPPAIIEATRHGVNLGSLGEFLDADSIVVLRPIPVTDEEKKRFVCRAVCELGKEYDYAFNLANKQKQFCCKLVCSLFPDLPMADVFDAGTAMIPDDFVRPALFKQSSMYQIVLLICDGQRIQADHQEEALEQLLRDGCRQPMPGLKSLFCRNRKADLMSCISPSETVHREQIPQADQSTFSANHV